MADSDMEMEDESTKYNLWLQTNPLDRWNSDNFDQTQMLNYHLEHKYGTYDLPEEFCAYLRGLMLLPLLDSKKGLYAQLSTPQNCIIEGNPGTGKTSLAVILAELLFELGYTSKKFDPLQDIIVASSTNSTKLKQAALNCRGGVVIVDESHILGSEALLSVKDKKSAILFNTIFNEMFTGAKGTRTSKTTFILIGYGDTNVQANMSDLFLMDPGFQRRCPNIILLENCTARSLAKMFFRQVEKHKRYDWDDSLAEYSEEEKIKELTDLFQERYFNTFVDIQLAHANNNNLIAQMFQGNLGQAWAMDLILQEDREGNRLQKDPTPNFLKKINANIEDFLQTYEDDDSSSVSAKFRLNFETVRTAIKIGYDKLLKINQKIGKFKTRENLTHARQGLPINTVLPKDIPKRKAQMNKRTRTASSTYSFRPITPPPEKQPPPPEKQPTPQTRAWTRSQTQTQINFESNLNSLCISSIHICSKKQ